MRRFLVLAVLLAMPAAQGSHMGNYAYVPLEHDDQGRSVEPDFGSTAVLGAIIVNAVVDQDRDGVAVPDPLLPQPFPGLTDQVAPGCTDDAGRQPTGLCALYSTGAGTSVGVSGLVLPPGVVGVQGMSGDAAPGAFTPSKATQVRFLDARVSAQMTVFGSGYVEVNRKADDAAAHAGLPDPADLAAGPSAVWAWYGRWQDKNGNGVIDANYGTGNLNPPAQPINEFVWYGNCERFPGIPNPDSVRLGFCAYDTEAAAGGRTEMFAYLFPGNHHANNGGFDIDPVACVLCSAPADLPGRQVYHFLGTLGLPVCAEFNPLGGLVCGTSDPAEFDENDEESFGDPLLGPQASTRPDGHYDDRTGDPAANLRGWLLAYGWPAWFYDQSLLVRLVHVTTVGCAQGPAGPDPAACRFADVDRYDALDPALERLVQEELKPAARGAWLLVRDNWPGISGSLDGVLNHRLLPPTPVTGPANDAAYAPGFSREPNDPRDAYPAARHNVRSCPPGDALHNGWCNDYAAHQAGPRPFIDAQPFRVLYTIFPFGAGNCITCVAGPGAGTEYAGEAPGSPVPVRLPGDHRRTLGPGNYFWHGSAGLWQDKPQTWAETVFDPLSAETVTRRYAAPPDGWVGNVVNTTGAWHYRGYGDEECTTDQGTGTWPYAWCHPYLDGALEDPQA